MTVLFEWNVIALKMVQHERTDAWVDIIVDDGPPQKVFVDGAAEFLTVATDLGSGVHKLDVCKRVEAMFGTVQFLGCELSDGGRFLAPPAHLTRRLDIVGDSISCGSGNEGKNGDPNIAEHENNGLAYGTLTARALQAAHANIQAAGDARVHHMLLDKVDIERDGLGETGHPNWITHAHMAEQLTQAIRATVGW